MNPAQQSFAVHLESLLSFAQELTTQVHGITKPSGELEGLLAAPVLLGAFNEADSLTVTHNAAVAEMRTLLADVTEALSFANDVTKTVADGYSRVDEDLASYLTSSGVLADSGATTPGHAGSTVAVSAHNPVAGTPVGTGVPVGTGTHVGAPPAVSGTPPVEITARADGHPGVQLDISGTTVTAGVDGLHVGTADPATGTTTDISVPVDLTSGAGPTVAPVAAAGGPLPAPATVVDPIRGV